ncbi:hypothetical protein L249_2384 [Ophiocordyceps polyrhachis-furcata BCC 54312]|uniref:SART-1 protein n=1 Tax=Ophiocordyceps polyrhachis-furcata BCC 54312 TaxID=1330021 RepID=A0A367LRX6_9HYPO|nr:hypothetical protein L249_2384 [Ophiocordyceps polyrhachis-furcata BCC 54312]
MDAATIQETNRIRLSLGMKPLPVPGAEPSTTPKAASDSHGDAASTLESRQAQAYDNYKTHMDADRNKQRREAKAAAIRKARDAAQRFAILEGQGLGEMDQGGDLDAKTWLMGQKKRQKKIAKARKLEEEMAAAEAEAAASVKYSSKDLAGIKVTHDSSAFIDGNEQILTLKDATIEENEEEGDELENINIREHEKLTDKLDLKKKRPVYNPLDDDNEDGQRGILSQYDDEILGKRTKQFTLDANGTVAELADILDQPARKANEALNVSLDDIIKVKKPSKKSKNTRKKLADEDDVLFQPQTGENGSAMEVDGEQSSKKKRKAETESVVDDDELQSSLATQRNKALKKRKISRPEDIAKQVRAQADDEPEPGADDGEEGLIIGETSEFVANLRKHDDDDDDEQQQRAKKQGQVAANASWPQPDEDEAMADADDKDDGDDDDAQANGNGAAADDDGTFDDEKTVGGSLSATLALLRERGLIEDSRGDSTHRSQRERREFLQRKRQLEEEVDERARLQRERDRASGKLDRMSRADREDYARQQNAWRDQQHSRRMADLISSTYKPTVELKYTDEHGRQLDRKEAFKHLSHQFHGKGSGKGKTEKKLKQVEEEKRREAQSLFDASQGGGMRAATSQQLKKRKEAGVRLG